MHYSRLIAIWSLLPFAITGTHAKTCKIPAQGNASGDDSPAIVEAFTKCKRNSNIIFQNTTYYIKTALSFKDLDNVNIDIRGRLEVSGSSVTAKPSSCTPHEVVCTPGDCDLTHSTVGNGHRLLAREFPAHWPWQGPRELSTRGLSESNDSLHLGG